MKKTLLLLFLMISVVATAQTTQDSVKTKTAFAELLGMNTNVIGLKGKLRVEVDFGDFYGGLLGNADNNMLVDENGKQIRFNSMVDAMNFMGEHGWKFEAAYVVTTNNQNVYHWLMSKVIPIDADPRDGIIQTRDKKGKKNKRDRETDKYADDIY